ncbi:hypothetical protein EDD11_003410 [Mortierella claussenii]|nr:hypothetical protein EDD11_003410 [Mortierella claussenii]
MPAQYPLIKYAERPTVLIVGAGVGGLMLAILLEKAGVPYQIFDRMTEVKPLGAAMSLGWNVATLFKQIGIYDEYVSISKPALSVDTYNEDRKLEFSMLLKSAVQMGGSNGYFTTRSQFHNLLRRQVPAKKLHMGKRVLSIQQNEFGVRIQFSDNTAADGDILVGADGAYSAVRQSLYKSLKKKNKLPSSDDGALPFSCWVTMAMKGNVYGWAVIQYLDKETSKDNDSFRNSEWGPEAAGSMCNEARNFPIPGGVNGDLTLGELIDQTPLVSKVMLEEKVFDTWYSGRTVLLGDACHKIHPASGAGAVNAIHDAVALANWISVLDSTTVEDVEKIFKEYKAERHPAAVASFKAGQALTKISGVDRKAKIVRYVARNMPGWLHNMAARTLTARRPQVSFLTLVKDEGTLQPKHQPSLQKTLAIHKARAMVASRPEATV